MNINTNGQMIMVTVKKVGVMKMKKMVKPIQELKSKITSMKLKVI